MSNPPRHIRVFLSSPGDVGAEREKADEILEKLPREHAWKGKFTIAPVRWDDPHAPIPMDAHLPPQDAVNQGLQKPSECDFVVVILWGRMGTPLPESYKKPDGGSYLSGTEWEYEDACKDGKAAGRRVLLYRRTEEPTIRIKDPDYAEKLKQYESVEKFFERFQTADGSLTGGYTPYPTVDEFEKRFQQDMEGVLRRLEEKNSEGGSYGGKVLPTKPTIPQTYRDWLKSDCGGVDLLGMRVRHGQAVRLNHIYVPITTSTPGITTLIIRTDPPKTLKSKMSSSLALGALAQDSLYLSGGPGSGKSTFCRWVAWLVAEGAMPVHEPESPKKYAEQFPEELRNYLPVLVRLRDFWRYLPHLVKSNDLSQRELEQALTRWQTNKTDRGLNSEDLIAHLQAGTTLLILDGVDEVPISVEEGGAMWSPRSLLISALKQGCPAWMKSGNRILLTSRPDGLAADEIPQGLQSVPIEGLPEELQDLLLRRWFRVLADSVVTAEATTQDMQSHLGQHPWLKALTANPLLLTAMCIVYDEGKRLPHDKHDLYDRIIDTVLHGRYRDPVAKERARNRLGVIAHGMHTGEALGEERVTPQAEATNAEIERMLQVYQDCSAWTEAGCLGAVETREELLSNSGLLLSSGDKRARFYHLSFQEFLAGQRLLDVADSGLLAVFCERAAVPDWRNTLSLLFGRVLGASASPEKGIRLMREMIAALTLENLGLQLVVADGVETLLAKNIQLPTQEEDRLRYLFLGTMRGNAPPRDRVSLGNTLAKLGDPRFDPDHWYLPEDPMLGFVEIPAGPFLMGSDKKRDSKAFDEELEQHQVDLPSYYLARWPVTVAQYRFFVEATDYETDNSDALNGVANHPAVNVSWHDAMAYCRWLNKQLRTLAHERCANPGQMDAASIAFWQGLAKGKLGVGLPSEAEWEKAARGTDGRVYPWGSEANPEYANYAETGISMTSAVGCFPQGKSPFGCEEMSGNVDEWTRSILKSYLYQPKDGREDLKSELPRVLRGGVFFDLDEFLRCASRYLLGPGFRNYRLGFRVVVSPFFSER
jgi:formylglycine-generating enzyme required for sulfatase activity